MGKAVITGDIVESTKLNQEENHLLIEGMKQILEDIGQDATVRSELFLGDSLQCLCQHPAKALKYALLIKTYIRGLLFSRELRDQQKSETEQLNNRSIFDIRLAIGIGEVYTEKEQLSVSQGEAFRLSGRLLDEMKNKQTFAIKTNDTFNSELETSFKMLDFILSNTTQNQCEVIHYKIKGLTETEIAEKIGVNQSAINQRSNSSGWNAINALIQRFENIYT